MQCPQMGLDLLQGSGRQWLPRADADRIPVELHPARCDIRKGVNVCQPLWEIAVQAVVESVLQLLLQSPGPCRQPWLLAQRRDGLPEVDQGRATMEAKLKH